LEAKDFSDLADLQNLHHSKLLLNYLLITLTWCLKSA